MIIIKKKTKINKKRKEDNNNQKKARRQTPREGAKCHLVSRPGIITRRQRVSKRHHFPFFILVFSRFLFFWIWVKGKLKRSERKIRDWEGNKCKGRGGGDLEREKWEGEERWVRNKGKEKRERKEEVEGNGDKRRRGKMRKGSWR